MKRVVLLVFLAMALVMSSAYSKVDKKKAEAKPTKPTKGYVANLSDILKGGNGKINSAKAKELLNNCHPLVLAVESGKKIKVYFVYHPDGTFAAKKLADYASAKAIGVVGKIKTVQGMNMIIADAIQPME